MSIQKKVIRILLADGNPDGIRIVEVPTETLMITMFPRTQIKQFFDRDEAKKAGIYILFETMDMSSKPKIYIGKTENLYSRMTSHDRDKEWWNQALVLTSTNGFLTSTQIAYLESKLIEAAKKAKRAQLEQNDQQLLSIPEAEEAQIEIFLEQFILVLKALFINIFEPLALTELEKEDMQNELAFKFSGLGLNASMKIVSNKFVVLKDSEARIEETGTCPNKTKILRQQLIENGLLIANNGKYVFTDDVPFDSISSSASVVSGSSVNGNDIWVQGHQSYDQIEQQSLLTLL